MVEVVNAAGVYPKETFLRMTGMRQAAWLAAVKNGLQVARINGRVFVRGDEWLRYVAEAEAKCESRESVATH